MNGFPKLSALSDHPPRGRAVAHPSHGPAPYDVPARVWLGRALAVAGLLAEVVAMMWAVGYVAW